jgi:MFS family permease
MPPERAGRQHYGLTFAILGAGTLISALASSMGILIVGRVMQGIGGAVFPARVRDHPPRVPA